MWTFLHEERKFQAASRVRYSSRKIYRLALSQSKTEIINITGWVNEDEYVEGMQCSGAGNGGRQKKFYRGAEVCGS